jgi:phosphatidylglycerol:prolipoprotein diacylglycerol transferase
MAPSVADPTMRKMTQVVALVPPIVAFLLLKPASFADQTLMQLSTSQWVALLTAVPAAIAYAIYFKAAEAHPESALALNLEPFYAAHPEQAPGATTDEAAVPDVGSEGEKSPTHQESKAEEKGSASENDRKTLEPSGTQASDAPEAPSPPEVDAGKEPA